MQNMWASSKRLYAQITLSPTLREEIDSTLLARFGGVCARGCGDVGWFLGGAQLNFQRGFTNRQEGFWFGGFILSAARKLGFSLATLSAAASSPFWKDKEGQAMCW